MLKKCFFLGGLLFICTTSTWAIDVKTTTKQANQGNINAQIALANHYKSIKDYQNELFWTDRLAHQGIVSAQFNMGLIYANGQAVVKNYSRAKEWFARACENNHRNACHNFNILVQQGF